MERAGSRPEHGARREKTLRCRVGSQMRAELGQARWLVIIGGLLLACGGHASRDARESETRDATGTNGGGASSAGMTASSGAASGGTGASAGTATDGLLEIPNIVTLIDPSGDAEAMATPFDAWPCFRGFTSTVNGMRVEFVAFVQTPGDYQGDSIHILNLDAYLADGRVFSAGDSWPLGEIHLHVTAASPRFVGGLKGILYDRTAKDAPPLTLSLAFDVEAGDTCAL